MPVVTARKSAIVILCCLSTIVTSVAIAQDAPASDGKKPRIGLIMKSLANEFFSTMRKGAEKHHADNKGKYDLVVNGIRDERDLSAQVALVEQMASQKVDAIVIAPADSKALVPALRRAAKAGSVIVNIDNRLDADLVKSSGISIPFVGPDNRDGARRVGEVLAAKLKPGAKVAILEGVPTAYNAQQRRLGFEDAMKKAGANVVSVQSGQWEMEKANTVSAGMLSEHPDLAAILASNDSMALGAVAAVKSAGKTGKVLIVGFDNISAIQPMIKDGRVLATADQHGDQLAVFGIQYALDIIGGAKPADKETPVDIITADKLK